MDTQSGIPHRIGPDICPVILPLGGPGGRAEKTPSDHERGHKSPAMDVQQFSFPAIPHSQKILTRKSDLRAIWPQCDCAAAIQACDELAATICCRLPRGRPAVLALTSPGDGDGKTTLAEALAPELAHRTPGGILAVDADYRKADLTARLMLPTEAEPSESSLIYPTDLPDLSVLPMSLERADRCFDRAWTNSLREKWPLVLFDTASLEHAETTRLLRHCDGVCLVVRLGHTLRRAVTEAARIIASCGDHLLGCVVVGK